MKKGESRFFLNWLMPSSISSALCGATSDQERQQICESWLDHTRIADDLENAEQQSTQMSII